MIGLIYAVTTMLAIVLVTGLAAFTCDVARVRIAANRAARGAIAAQVERERAPFMDEAKREIDRMLSPWEAQDDQGPVAGRIGDVIAVRPKPPWERIGGRLDAATGMIRVPGFMPCSEEAWALKGSAALEPFAVYDAAIRSIRRAVQWEQAREGEHLVEFTTVDGTLHVIPWATEIQRVAMETQVGRPGVDHAVPESRTLQEIDDEILRAMAKMSIPTVVVPRDPADAEVARQLTEFMRSPEMREKLETEAYNRLKYGPDEKGWPS